MRPGRLTLAVALALAGCAPVTAPQSTVASASAPVADTRLQALVDRYVAQDMAPGIVIAVGHGDAPPHFYSAGHISDDEGAAEAGPDSLWRIYSMTKPVTAMAVMQLVEDGKIGLDQPVSDFIPAFAEMRVLTDSETSLDSRPARHPVTIRHLLTHSGGLIYPFLGKGPLQDAYNRLGLIGGRVPPAAMAGQPADLADFANRVASLPLIAEPGTSWHYSVSSDVLGRVIEVASGMAFDRFVQERLLDPLGMTSTYWTVPTSETGRFSTVYAWVDGRRVPIDTGAASDWLHPPRMPFGGSGLVSSARDYDRLLRMLANGGEIDGVRVLRTETVRLALSNLLPDGVRVVGTGTPDTAVAEGYGAGGWVYLSDVPGGVHAGTYGWFGAGGTIAFIDPVKGIRVTAMVNYFPADKWPLQRDIIETLYGK
ncbi:serine hydrolase domain-containing protein [Stakelama tenebrarum]|uniref:Beta-lactamase family protein n=1 Tax=Stakelama tenebrarum TaxID=2711215 RepID=A0A6G6Y0X0_9SPHN|nr:serine hydrolase domain-containing protein [Sphingosinithalassobacter tenebrarum]QIG78594.1 beta-lactamase family protein [Sphingosinithalassobacter tenebrarum]